VAPEARAGRANEDEAVAGGLGAGCCREGNDASNPWANRDVIDVVAARDGRQFIGCEGDHRFTWCVDLRSREVERKRDCRRGRTGTRRRSGGGGGGGGDAGGLAAVNATAARRAGWRPWCSGQRTSWPSVGIQGAASGCPPAGYVGGDVYNYALMRI